MRFPSSFALIFSFGTLLFLSACAEKNVAVIDQTDEEDVNPQPDAVDQRTITGSFQSVSGVMDKLSCYCSDGGYVTTDDGEKVAVCFDETVESCPKITITGYKTSKKIASNGACPEGIMGFLKVQSYIIGETDY